MDLTNELLEKARGAQSAEELLTLAGESGIELTREEAEAKFALLRPTDGELADSELDNIVGGCGGSKTPAASYAVGQTVEFYDNRSNSANHVFKGKIESCKYTKYSCSDNTSASKPEWVYTVRAKNDLFTTLGGIEMVFTVREQDIKGVVS